MPTAADKQTLSRFHLFAVIWLDAHHSLEEFSLEEVGRTFHGAAREINYGLLLQDDTDGVTLAMEEGADKNFRHTFFIPRAMIVEMIDLGQPRRKRVRRPRPTAPGASATPTL